MSNLLEWLTLKPVRDAVKKNTEAHEKLQRAMQSCSAKGLKEVNDLLKGEQENAAN